MSRSRLLPPLVAGVVVMWAAALVAGCGDLGPAIPRVFTQISAGGGQTCALAAGGLAYCWGNNYYDQLGTGSTSWENCDGPSCSTTPMPVLGGLRFSAVTVGGIETCGVTPGGTAYCWGLLAPGFFSTLPSWVGPLPRSLPGRVVGGLPFAELSAGFSFVCGVTGAGAAYCLGDNTAGALGIGQYSPGDSSPVAVAGNLVFSHISAGEVSSCGVTLGGVAYCWGDNYTGALGTGDTTSHPSPAAVTGGLVFATVTAGGDHSCGLTAGAAAYCWGSNGSGELGVGDTRQRLAPVPVQGGLAFSAVSAGGRHTCGLAAGRAYCWGFNFAGQLGVGDTINRMVPTPVAGGLTFASISTGDFHTCALTSSGAAYCWGMNESGELGVGDTINRMVPTPVAVGGPP
jgi:alpha-tubulin suppressor-like RCC1 family protein